MCFTQQQSFIIALIGLANTALDYYVTQDWKLPFCVFYFALMELLQFFQYSVIDQCDNPINKILTIIGWIHISFQPVIPAIGFLAFSREGKVQKNLRFFIKIAIFASIFLFLRWPMSYLPMFKRNPALISDDSLLLKNKGIQFGVNDDGSLKGAETVCGRPWEYLRGPVLCSFSGKKHLSWSIPLAEPQFFFPAPAHGRIFQLFPKMGKTDDLTPVGAANYYVAGMSFHCFFFFAPFFFIKHDMIPYFAQVLLGILFFATGPYLTSFISNDPLEQPAIWCVYSIIQLIGIQLYLFMVMGFSWAKLRPGAPTVRGARAVGENMPSATYRVNKID